MRYSVLNEGDVVEVLDGFVKNKIGTIIKDIENKISEKECLQKKVYKLDFSSGWVGWHERSNLRIIKRNKIKKTCSPCDSYKEGFVLSKE
jgi:hypothetical protein